jgi:hypothetical protein
VSSVNFRKRDPSKSRKKMPINCKRCGIEIRFDDGKCINANTDMPHSIRKCNTKPGYVYCPKCMNVFPRRNVCEHYRKYAWEPDHSEQWFIDIINEDYYPGDWFKRKQKRKTSFDKMKEGQKCNLCGMIFAKNATRQDMDEHEKECKLQTKLV